MAHYKVSLFKSPMHFGATVLRLTFAFFFILIAVKKFRMGIGPFVNGMILNPETLVAQEIPDFLLVLYGYGLPWAELIAGTLLLFDRYTKIAYAAIAAIYLSFVFGQAYNGAGTVISEQYMASILAVIAGYWMHEQDEPRRA